MKAIECNDGGTGAIWAAYYNSTEPGYGVYNMDDKSGNITHYWDSPGWVAAGKMVRKWNQAGYYGKEPWPAADSEAQHKAGKGASLLHNMKPGGEAELKQITGFDWTAKILAKNFLDTNSLIATMIGVNKQTTAPEACVKYFEMANTDIPFYNLICFGIEGKHWVWVDKDKKIVGFPSGVTPDNSGYNPTADWEYGNQFNAYYTDATKVGAWEATKKLNDEATPSPLIGFSFDQTPVKTEAAQIAAVTKEYILMGIGFLDFDTKMPEYQKRVTDAGAVKVLAEINKQLADWRSSTK
jgi:putative aldouronate transport system substrate-binding protein